MRCVRLLSLLLAWTWTQSYVAGEREARFCHQSCYKMGVTSDFAHTSKLQLFKDCKADLIIKLMSTKSMGCAFRLVYTFGSLQNRTNYQNCEHGSTLYAATIRDYSFVARDGIKDFPCFLTYQDPELSHYIYVHP